MRIFGIAIFIIVIIGLIGLGIFAWQNLRGIGPAILPPSKDIVEVFKARNETDFPLELPAGFTIEIFAAEVPSARVLAFDNSGSLWVSQRGEGRVIQFRTNTDGTTTKETIMSGLKNPHGLAFDPDDLTVLFVAEENRIMRHETTTNITTKLTDLAAGGRHATRTIGFGDDGRLYVSNGSSCDTCFEDNPQRAAIWSLNKDGSDFKSFAQGLRNAVFFTFHPTTGKIWTTEMGRDFLGDDLPPDEINIVETGNHYGWPNCYGQNVLDTKFDSNANCDDFTPSHIDIPAHSAPLGLAFTPANSDWPAEYQNNLYVSYHGSWNRTIPTGYKIVRYRLDEQGAMVAVDDFISGWLDNGRAIGRPVDIAFDATGDMYISDDKAGVIYKVSYHGAEPEANSEPCIITGCSSQVCADEEKFSTCEFLAEYACYANATCERQADGECSWTITNDLTTCLDNPPPL